NRHNCANHGRSAPALSTIQGHEAVVLAVCTRAPEPRGSVADGLDRLTSCTEFLNRKAELPPAASHLVLEASMRGWLLPELADRVSLVVDDVQPNTLAGIAPPAARR